jgi:branched-chain amino acid transport system substrate-binding protein
MAWGAGRDSFSGVWPIVWHHTLGTPKSKAFTAAFTKRWGKPPENQAVGDYLGVKVVAQAMTETKSTDPVKLVEYLEKGAKFDVLRTREGYFRDWDHQMLFEMYTLTPKAKDKMADKWDMAEVSPPVPAPNEPLETIAPTRQENPCSFA